MNAPAVLCGDCIFWAPPKAGAEQVRPAGRCHLYPQTIDKLAHEWCAQGRRELPEEGGDGG